MPRASDDDSLEPILPKHPTELSQLPKEPLAPRARPSWDRLVLVGCAVVATLALIVCAIRLNSIAEDERLQACQVRVFAEEQVRSNPPSSSRFSADRYQERLAECIGIEIEDTDTDTDTGD